MVQTTLIIFYFRGFFNMGGLSKIFGGGSSGTDRSAQAMEKQEKENQEMLAQEQADSRELAEKESSKRRVRRRRGTQRALLSDQRLNPETGVETSLGAKTIV